MNKEQIILKSTNWLTSKDSNDMVYMMNNEDGIKDVFRGRADRVATANYSWMIKSGDKNIGFINLLVEKQNYNFLFLDMGIIKEYRGKGYGKKLLEEVKKIVESKNLTFVLMETRKDNGNANSVGKDVGCFITEIDDRNIYLLQKSRLQEFIDSNQMEELAMHYNGENSKRDLVKQYL